MESFMSDMKSQSKAVMAMVGQQQLEHHEQKRRRNACSISNATGNKPKNDKKELNNVG